MSEAAAVSIRAIAAGGDGVGTLGDGRTVFVPRTAPGDVVTLRQVRSHARFARAEVATLVSQAPGRVTPPCPHYTADQCGGCQLMHLDMATQLSAKQRIVGDALRRIARLDSADPPIEPASHPVGYRAKVTFTVQRGTIGFHRRGEAGRVFEVRTCLLVEPAIDKLHQALRAGRERLPRDATQLVLRRDAEGGRHVIVRTAGRHAWTDGPALAASLGAGIVLWWHPEGGAARAVAGSPEPWPATVFEQVHPAMAREVRRRAIDGLTTPTGSAGGESDRQKQRVAWDLYAGIGEATAALAERGLAVESVELDPRAVSLATRRGPTGPRRLAGDAAELVGRMTQPGLVLTNPPRRGMAAEVTAALLASGAERIAYVSCDPATLARDLHRLEEGYRLADLAAFDQFPQTAHVECVAILERR